MHIVSSEEALAFAAVPGRLLVIGAGAIGLELGSVWARLGSEVHVVELLDRIVPGMDAELARGLQRSLERQGLTFTLGASVRKALVEDGRVRVSIESGTGTTTEMFDRVLVAVGRRPYTRDLGLEVVGVTADPRGRILVDGAYQTSVPGLFAIGDVIAGPMLAHKAEDEGIACVERMAGGAGHVNYDAIPSVVYTWPELAAVGKTEEECLAHGLEVKVGRFPFMANGRARAAQERDGLVKVIASDPFGPGPRRPHPRASRLRSDRGGGARHGVRGQRGGHRPHLPRASHVHGGGPRGRPRRRRSQPPPVARLARLFRRRAASALRLTEIAGWR